MRRRHWTTPTSTTAPFLPGDISRRPLGSPPLRAYNTLLIPQTLRTSKPRTGDMRTPLPSNSWVDFQENWLPTDACHELHGQLLAAVTFEQRSVTLFGRVVAQPRLIGWCGTTSYRYSGLTLAPRVVPECLTRILEQVSRQASVEFNHLLLNLYRDGRDSMGMHADDEAELGHNPVVATLTLGATRKFLLRSRTGSHRADYALGDGSLLIMGGQCQAEYVHGIPKTRQTVGSRLSITFRRVEKG